MHSITTMAGLAILAAPASAFAESRDLKTGALQQMCRSSEDKARAPIQLGCAAFIDGFVRGYTRGRGCPAKEYTVVIRRLLQQDPAKVGDRLADEVLAKIVDEVHSCRGI